MSTPQEFLKSLPSPDSIFSSWYPILFAVSCGVVFAVRQYMRGPRYMGQVDLKGKTAIVTGANKGIGKEVAKDLACKGARVILACRNLELAEAAAEDIRKAADTINVECMKLDLASLKSVREFAAEFKRKESDLHILVNNGGVMMTPYMETEDGFELQFGTNYLGPFLLTELLLDVLKKSAPSRIVNVSAAAQNLGEIDFEDMKMTADYSPGKSFARSKLALTLYNRKLVERLEGTKVTANCVNPGVVNTEAHKYMPYRTNKFLSLSLSVLTWLLMKKADDGAQTVLYVACAPDLETVTGKFYKDCVPVDLEGNALDDKLKDKLYAESLEWTGLK